MVTFLKTCEVSCITKKGPSKLPERLKMHSSALIINEDIINSEAIFSLCLNN